MSNELNIEKIKNAKEDLTLNVKVITNAKQNSIEFLEDGSIKLRISKVPVEGKANKEIIEYLSKTFNKKRADIVILKGEKSSHKVILLKV